MGRAVPDQKDPKPAAKIFRKPIHDKATRKVVALPQLLRESERPDGAKASVIDDESDVVVAETRDINDGGLFDDLFEDD